MYLYKYISVDIIRLKKKEKMEDENLRILKDDAIKTKQALENAFTEKEAQKTKLESIYKLLSKTDDELEAIFLEIESDRNNTGVPLDENYNDSYWKWKDADEANEIAQTKMSKYEMNMAADIPDIMIELKEVQSQNEELKNEMKELKNEMQEMKAMLPQMMMSPLQELTQMVKFLHTREFLSNINPPFTGQNQEVDIVFPEPVEARYITFKPKAWNNYPCLRCEVYVDNVLQNTPLNQRSISSYNGDSYKDSTMNTQGYGGWLHKSPYNTNEWLRLDLQQRKTITGIRVGTQKGYPTYYVSNLALEFSGN